MNAHQAQTLAAKIDGAVYYGRNPYPIERMWTARVPMGADAEHPPVAVYTHPTKPGGEELVSEGPDAFRVLPYFGAYLDVQLYLNSEGEPEILPEIVINACGYKVQATDDMVVFSEADPIATMHMRFAFTLKCLCWWIDIHGQNPAVMASHVVAAYGIVCQCYGGNNAIRRRPTRPIR